ncbi:MAG: TPM domain-containing protein, partial [Chloroflexota bacterium]
MKRLLPVLGVLFATLAWLAPAGPARGDTPPGPPFPDPVRDQAVYDMAGLFSAGTITAAEGIIDRIEERTGAEVVVYTQVKPGATTESTEEDAIDLIDQWGVGRQ